jgi:hypothetical protein
VLRSQAEPKPGPVAQLPCVCGQVKPESFKLLKKEMNPVCRLSETQEMTGSQAQHLTDAL